ncbi:MAG TPA: aspartate aminotransferase family protein [Clostridiales bacterium]|nr:aspartate aminotransferase family protein [Clostridiales bacterium]
MGLTSGPEKQAILATDLEHVWHPMTQHSLLAGKPPMLVVEAFGSTVVDADGKSYIDTMAGLWCVTAGYGQTAIADRVYRQMKTLPYYPHTAANVPAAELARELSACLGGDLKRIYFTCSGSEANDAAFKLARQFGRLARPGENRYKIIARHRAYHGTTMGALSATGQSERKWRFEPLVPGFLHAAPAYCYRCAFGKSYPACDLECAAQIETMILHEGPETVAAVIVEPVVGGGGILVPVDEYLPVVREITRRYGVLLIADEVISGFGRTGRMFGFQTYGIEPDIVTMAKGLTSAYLPLGAVATTGAIFSAFLGELEDRVHLVQVNTFGGHPVACAAGLANLELLAEQRLVERAADAGRRFLGALKDLERYPLVGEVRGKGMIFGIELVADKKTKAPATPAIINRVVARALEQGVILGKTTMTTFHLNNVITLSPPLVITSEELDTVLAVLHATLKDL